MRIGFVSPTGLPVRVLSYLWKLIGTARNVPGLLAFPLFAITASAHLGGRLMPGIVTYAVAVVLMVITYLQMLVFQDIRDTLLEPGSAVRVPPVGTKVSVLEKIGVGALSLGLSLSVVVAYDPNLLAANGVVLVWLGLVLAGYFAPDLLRRMPTLCVVGHMIGAPAAGFLLSALEWGPTRQGMPDGLWSVLVMFFAHACTLDIGDRIAGQSKARRAAGARFTPEGLHAPIGMMVAAAVAAYSSLIAYGHYLGLGTRFAEMGILVGIPFVCGLVGIKVYPNQVMETAIRSWSRTWMVLCYVLAAVVPLIWGR